MKRADDGDEAAAEEGTAGSLPEAATGEAEDTEEAGTAEEENEEEMPGPIMSVPEAVLERVLLLLDVYAAAKSVSSLLYRINQQPS